MVARWRQLGDVLAVERSDELAHGTSHCVVHWPGQCRPLTCRKEAELLPSVEQYPLGRDRGLDVEHTVNAQSLHSLPALPHALLLEIACSLALLIKACARSTRLAYTPEPSPPAATSAARSASAEVSTARSVSHGIRKQSFGDN